MYLLLGDKWRFAIEVEILEFEPSLWGRSAVWLGGERIGIYENEVNVLGPFMWSLMRITNESEQFWLPELEGLGPKETYLKCHPFRFDSEAFYDASEEEQSDAARFDIFLMQWGENFDQCELNVVIHKGNCKFFYNQNFVKNIDEIKFIDIPLGNVRDVYEQLYIAIPSTNWPSRLPKPLNIKSS